jgi:hypothetical protein
MISEREELRNCEKFDEAMKPLNHVELDWIRNIKICSLAARRYGIKEQKKDVERIKTLDMPRSLSKT